MEQQRLPNLRFSAHALGASCQSGASLDAVRGRDAAPAVPDDEDPRALHEVAAPQASRLGQQAEGPFEAEPLRPARGAAAGAAEELDRRPDAERDAARLAAVREAPGHELALRRADGEEGEIGGLMLDEARNLLL